MNNFIAVTENSLIENTSEMKFRKKVKCHGKEENISC